MIETIAALLRAMLTGLGLIAVLDPVSTGSLVAVAVLVLSVAALVVVALATLYAGPSGPRTHPTRHTELTAPLAQSDPDAAGHVRRRGPGLAAAAA
ncbi:MAG: hypothetical protein ABS63_05030 [Microbacterium sp. SCN 70-27]|uniref:DUF6412 domain-containing protein n=1 Tax=unclassified Microbacterium TaxID=2609290 RepID=UPI00086A1E43|nr:MULTISPECIES: DUF6412 domain-containing protein [unclassified Microbacterium]ODT28273.1 MAG: hypothetical protein ABS63_05030 [Microbacterium sp. SCN 70-27]